MLNEYYRLTKPGIIYGNDLAVIGAFLMASRWNIQLTLLCTTLVGISLIIASGCVFNNYIDRDIDAKMERTKRRPLVTGTISPRAALIFGSILGLAGGAILYVFTNQTATYVALFGLFSYVVPYSLWTKRNTMHSTLVGAIPGAVPPVVGYCAVTNSLDLGAFLLFLALAIWQVPHALAIAVRRYKDYTNASVPVMSVARGMLPTKILLCVYVALFIPVSLLLYFYGYAGKIYAVGIAILGIAWLIESLRGFGAYDDVAWGKRIFLYSLVMLLAFCVLIAIDPATL